MKYMKESFISGAFAMNLLVARVVGLAPVTFAPKASGWTISTSRTWTWYGYVLITSTVLLIFTEMSVTIFIIQYHHKVYQKDPLRITDKVVWVMKIMSVIVTSGAAVYTAPNSIFSTMSCLNQVQKINYDLGIYYWTNTWTRKTSFLMVAQIVLCMTLSLTEYALKMITFMKYLSFTMAFFRAQLFYFISLWILQLRSLQFVAMVLHVKHSFKVLNNKLNNILDDLKNVTNPGMKKVVQLNNYLSTKSQKTSTGIIGKKISKHCAAVRVLAVIFDRLCHVLQDVNQSNGPMVILMLCSYILHLIFSPYFLILTIIEERPLVIADDVRAPTISIQCLWCLFYIFNLVMIIEPCHLTHVEMERTSELVGRLMCCAHPPDNDPLMLELEQFVRYLKMNMACYKPLKLTKMTRALVFTILGNITTYIVIIFQLWITF